MAKISAEERDIAERTAIATTTFYNNDEVGKVRAGLAVRSIDSALERGYRVSVVDGGSYDDFLKGLEGLGITALSENQDLNGRHSMGKSRRQAFADAFHNSDRRVIAWTEPEKYTYIPEIWKTAQPVLDGIADLVVADRGSLDSYPEGQKYAENLGNLAFKDITGHGLDMWSGARTFGRDNTRYFTDYKGEYGDLWDSIFIPVLEMIHGGERVIGIGIDYKHPEEMTSIESGIPNFHVKRVNQLANLVPALHAHWEKLKTRE